MKTVERARKLIEERLAELEKEAASLREALEPLERAAGRPPARRARRLSSSSGRRRAARGQRQEEFLAALRANPDASMSQIARDIGVRPQQLYPIARRLTEAGKISKRSRGGGYALLACGSRGEPLPLDSRAGG